jgi:hypothetical protein
MIISHQNIKIIIALQIQLSQPKDRKPARGRKLTRVAAAFAIKFPNASAEALARRRQCQIVRASSIFFEVRKIVT